MPLPYVNFDLSVQGRKRSFRAQQDSGSLSAAFMTPAIVYGRASPVDSALMPLYSTFTCPQLGSSLLVA